MRHADDDLVSAALGTELDRLVEHRDQHVQALERELLLPEERAAEVLLEALHLGEPTQEPLAALRVEPDAEATGLDRLPQPDPFGVIGDVLDLVRARAPCRPRAAAAAPRAASRPGRRGEGGLRGSAPATRASAAGRSRVSSSAGSPIGSEPSGSRRAARWPCIRYALTSAIAAATPPRRPASVGLRRAAGATGAGAAAAPFPARPSSAASTGAGPASKIRRHSGGTLAGASR